MLREKGKKRSYGWLLLSLCLLNIAFLARAAWAQTYYIDYVGGSDTTSGISRSAPWQRHPYMVGFSGHYTHAPGDTFIFKGGVTWPYTALPLLIKAGGTPGNVDSYTADPTWYSGGTYSLPIFDGGQQVDGSVTTLGPNSFLIGDGNQVSYVRVNGLKLINVGSPADGSGTCVVFVFGGSHIEISNNWLQPEGVQAFAYGAGNNNASAIYIHHNEIHRAFRGVVYGWYPYVVSDVRVYHNVWEGPGVVSNPSVGYHFDGLMIGNPIGGTCTSNPTATVTNISFYNNLFFGDWSHGATAIYYSNGCTSDTTLFNNVFAFDNASCSLAGNICFSPGFVAFVNHDRNISIYNNTFSSDACPGYRVGGKLGIAIGNAINGSVINIKNNLFSGIGDDSLSFDIRSSPAVSMNVDFNLYNPDPSMGGKLIGWFPPGYPGNATCIAASVPVACCTGNGTGNCNSPYENFCSALGTPLACCTGLAIGNCPLGGCHIGDGSCQQMGWENHGLQSSAYSNSFTNFMSLPNGSVGSGNWHLNSGSLARGAGTNLTSLGILALDSDLDGNARPALGAWDVGAYEFCQGGGCASSPPPAGGASGIAVRVYPNPWRADRGYAQRINFDPGTSPTIITIKLFTASGHLVKTLGPASAPIAWLLDDDTGKAVATGLYLYVVTNDHGQKARGKVAVIR